MNQFKLEIISPSEIVFEKEIDLVIFPGSEGDFGVLKNHMPFLTYSYAGLIIFNLRIKSVVLRTKPG